MRFASVPVGSVRSRLDWADATLALPISAVANTTTPKIFLIAGSSGSLVPPPELSLLDPRLRQRTARAAVPSIDQFHARGVKRPRLSDGRAAFLTKLGRCRANLPSPTALPTCDRKPQPGVAFGPRGAHETAPVPIAARRRGSGVSARGARAAERAGAACR